jgi:O-antigen/teichoic acid export membrane protein
MDRNAHRDDPASGNSSVDANANVDANATAVISSDAKQRLVAVLSSGVLGLVIIGLAATIRVPLLLGAIGASDVGLVITIISGGQIAMVGIAGARTAARVMATEGPRGGPNAASAISLRGDWRWSTVVPVLVFAGVVAVALPTVTSSQSRGEFVVAIVTSCVITVLAFPGGRAWGELEARGALAAVNTLNALTSVIALGATWALLDAPYPVWVHATIGTLSAVSPFFITQVWCWAITRPRTNRVHRAPVHRATVPLVQLEAIRSLPGLAFRSLDPIILTALGLGAVVADFTIIQRITLMMTGLAVFARPVWSRGAAARRAEHAEQRDTPSRLHAYFRSTLVQATLLGGLGATGVVVGSWLATFVVDFTLASFWLLVVLSAVVVFLNALATVFITFLAGNKAARLASSIEVGSAAIKVALTVVLVTTIGAVGAVAATIVALGALIGLEYRLLRRQPDLLADRGINPSPDTPPHPPPPPHPGR